MGSNVVSPLVVIVGETASGKSSLAMRLARQFDGEIIAADSRTVYEGMDIGTAKPSAADRLAVKHHLIDITTPDCRFTAADFKRLAVQAIDDITARGKTPFLVGGTGLYVDAVLFDYSFLPEVTPDIRQHFEAMTVQQLQHELMLQGIPLPKNTHNARHLIRKLETRGEQSRRERLRDHTLIIGVEQDRQLLRERITERVDAMLASGLANEAQRLLHAYGSDCSTLRTIGYQEWVPFLEGKRTIDEVREEIIKNTNRYAKRQRTWFRRNKSIHWHRNEEESVALIATLLDKKTVV